MIKFTKIKYTSSNIKYVVCFVMMTLLCLFSCKTKSTSSKSRSIGAPGELLLVIDPSLQNTAVKKLIADFSNAEFPCVPQFEPTFKLTTISPNYFEGHFKSYRNVIVLKKIKRKSGSVKYKHDMWASSQQLVEIEFQSDTSFVRLFKENKDQIFDFLYYGDIKAMAKANAKSVNAEIQNFVKAKYNVDITIPQGFKLVKDSLGFSWFRLDYLEIIQSIIIHEFDMDSIQPLTLSNLTNLRNDVAEKYVPGPNKNSYMTTESRLPVISHQFKCKGSDVIVLRGLWKIDGFFMGGPFVDYFIKDEVNKKLIMIEGFVYAPKKPNKSYYVRQVESILQTVKLN